MRIQTFTGCLGSARRAATTIAIVLVLILNACSPHPQYFRRYGSYFDVTGTLAALPLVNLSKYSQAEVIVMNALIVELLDSQLFQIVDPGLVEEFVLRHRLRVTDRLPLETLREVGEQLGVEYVLVGSVNEFDFMHESRGMTPTVSVSLRIVTCSNGRIVWAATHSKRGDDSETVFGLGRVETLEQLAAITVKELAETLKPDGGTKR